MFWLAILPGTVFLIVLISGIVRSIKEGDAEVFWIEGLMLGLLIGILTLLLGGMIGLAITPRVSPVAVVDKEHPIYLVSLANDNYNEGELNGGFLFVTGSFTETEKFRYRYYQTGQSGAIASGEVTSSKALVFEDTPTNPYALKYQVVCPETDIPKSIFYFEFCDPSMAAPQYEIQFHIPKGSVVNSINIAP